MTPHRVLAAAILTAGLAPSAFAAESSAGSSQGRDSAAAGTTPKATTRKAARLIKPVDGPARFATLLNSLSPVATVASNSAVRNSPAFSAGWIVRRASISEPRDLTNRPSCPKTLVLLQETHW